MSLKREKSIHTHILVMAFINEKLTSEQQQEVNSWEIRYPRCSMGQILKYAKLENPWYWTIDREKKSYLFGVYYLRDFFNETVFVFIWNNKHYTVQFLSRYDEDDTLIWDVPENYACKSFVFPYNTEEGFIDDLRSALIAYGNSGTPRENSRKNLVKCNF